MDTTSYMNISRDPNGGASDRSHKRLRSRLKWLTVLAVLNTVCIVALVGIAAAAFAHVHPWLSRELPHITALLNRTSFMADDAGAVFADANRAISDLNALLARLHMLLAILCRHGYWAAC